MPRILHIHNNIKSYPSYCPSCNWGTFSYQGAKCRTKNSLFIPMNVCNYIAFTKVWVVPRKTELGWCTGFAWADQLVVTAWSTIRREMRRPRPLKKEMRKSTSDVCQGRERGQCLFSQLVFIYPPLWFKEQGCILKSRRGGFIGSFLSFSSWIWHCL